MLHCTVQHCAMLYVPQNISNTANTSVIMPLISKNTCLLILCSLKHNIYNSTASYGTLEHYLCAKLQMNNYIVRSYRDVIVITKFATRKASKAQSIVMY